MKKSLCTVAATVLAVGVLYTFSLHDTDHKSKTLQFLYPECSPIQDTVSLQGSIVAAQKQLVYAQGSSRVLEIYVSEGQTVAAGQCLLKLETASATVEEDALAAAALSHLRDTVSSGDLESAAEILNHFNAIPNLQTNNSKVYCLYSEREAVVKTISVGEGETVGSLFPCMELFCPDSLEMEASAGEDVVGLLAEEMECFVSVPAFAIESLPGTLTDVAPFGRQTTRLTGQTVYDTAVRIRMIQTDGLRPGYRAAAKIVIASRDQALLLPYEAIGQDADGQEYVMKLQGGRAVKQPVQTGSELEDRIEVSSGLDLRDAVMLHPDLQWEGQVIGFAAS